MLDGIAAALSNLVCDVRAGIANVPVHLAHDADVLVAIEERVLLLPLHSHATNAAVRSLVGLQAGVGQDDDQAPRVLVSRWDGRMLLGHQLGQLRGRERLGSCRAVHRVRSVRVDVVR